MGLMHASMMAKFKKQKREGERGKAVGQTGSLLATVFVKRAGRGLYTVLWMTVTLDQNEEKKKSERGSSDTQRSVWGRHEHVRLMISSLM